MKKTPLSQLNSVNVWGAVRIAGIYLLIGALWILLSDKVATEIAPDQAALSRISTYKGWGYILVTALLLYMLIRRHTIRVSRAEWELHQRVESYLELFNSASDGIFIADKNGQYVLVNEQACKLVGYTADELLAMNVRDLITAEDLDRVPLRFDKLQKGKTLIVERNMVRKDGSRVICEISASILPNGRYQSIVRDITERKVSEEALARSEKRYRSLFENMINGFARCQMVYDEDGDPVDFIYLDVNKAFTDLTGLENVIGWKVTELIPGIREANPELFEIYGRVAMTGEPDEFESYLPGLGSGIWFSVSVYSTEKGFFVAVFDLITERKQAQEKLQESERRYRELVQNANSAVIRWKRDGTITFFNEYAQNFFGYANEEILGRGVNILVPQTESTGGDLSKLAENIVANPQQYVNVVNENVCSDGRRVWMTWTNKPIYDENEQMVEILAVGADITERKRAEDALERSHKQLLSFIEQAPISIAMFDREMNYLAVSRRWVSGFGRGYTDIIGRNHYDVHPDIPDEWKVAYQRCLAGESSKKDDDVWVMADGTKFWLRWAVTPWTDENGNIGGIILSAEDISERKQAEAAAFQSERRYHRVLDAMMEGCQIIDFNWRYVYVNDVVAQQGKHKSEELLGKTMMEMYPGIEQTEMFAILQKSMADREQRRMENKFVFPDGSVGWFELSIQAAQEGLFILSTDITERKQAEGTIRNLARFPEENPNPVLRVDRDGRILYANSSSQVWLDEWNTNMGELLPDRWKGYVADIYNNNVRQTIDVSIQDRVFANDFVPVVDEGYVNIYGRDITKRKQAEEVLRLQNLRLQALREIDTAILAADSVANVVGAALEHIRELISCERANLALIEWENNEAVNFDVRDTKESAISTGARVSLDLIQDMLEVLSRNQPVIIDDLTALPDPPPQIKAFIEEGLRSRCILPLFSQGKLIGSFTLSSETPGYFDEEKINLGREVSNQVAIAITQNDLLKDLKKLNTELEQRVTERTSQLDIANKELEAFAYSVSHDLRAPLRAIDGFTRILMEEYEPSLDDEGKRVCGVISGETLRMGQLIDDLLAFSRLNRREMHFAQIDMQSIVDSVLEELMSEDDKKRITLKLEAVSPVVGDEALIRQVWVNLLANAIKFTSKKKRSVIQVGGTQRENELVYYVRDDGAGFEMEYVDKLFNVFQRLHGESEFEGTGVGLAIVKRVVHRHGGRVWAEGKVDEGATFHFTFPMKGNEND